MISNDGLPPRFDAIGACDDDRAVLAGAGAIEGFEQGFAALAGAPFALAVASGTAALHIALLAADIGPGDEVIVSPYGWGQTVAAVLATGATPVFADIDADTGNLDPAAARAVVSARTRSVLATHLFGLPADLDGLRALCDRHGLLLVADAAQALGATWHGRPVGAWADLTCFSLGPGKLLSVGEGGVVVTARPDLLERMILVSQHPLRALREVEEPRLRQSIGAFGLSLRLSGPAARRGLSALAGIAPRLAARRDLARKLSGKLTGLQNLVLPGDRGPAGHAWHAYVARAMVPNEEPDSAGCALAREAGDVISRPTTELGSNPDDGDYRAKLLEQSGALGLEATTGPVITPLHCRPPFAAGPRGYWYPRALRPCRRHPTWKRGACPRAERRCADQEIQFALI